MVHFFAASVFAGCLFVLFADSNGEGCPMPPSLTDGYVRPEKQFYRINESVSYICSRRHYLFGDKKSTCLLNGEWNGSTPYCASASENVKLMKDEDVFGVLIDGVKGTCLSANVTVEKSIYIRVNGFHPTVVVDISPKLFYFRNVLYEISYLNDSLELHNYENSLSYVNCFTDLTELVFICDFLEPLENPLIRIKLSINWSYKCSSCDRFVCEVIIFVKKENKSLECLPPHVENARWNKSNSNSYPVGTEFNVECIDGYESFRETNSILCKIDGNWTAFNCAEKSLPVGGFNRVLIYAISAGISLFLISALIVIIALKKRRKKELASEMQRDNYVEEENLYEQVNEIMHDFRPRLTVSSKSKLDPVMDPGSITELPPTSSCRPLSDEAGYLLPIMWNRKDEPDNQNSEKNTYCNVTEVSSSRQRSTEITSNLYANL